MAEAANILCKGRAGPVDEGAMVLDYSNSLVEFLQRGRWTGRDGAWVPLQVWGRHLLAHFHVEVIMVRTTLTPLLTCRTQLPPPHQ